MIDDNSIARRREDVPKSPNEGVADLEQLIQRLVREELQRLHRRSDAEFEELSSTPILQLDRSDAKAVTGKIGDPFIAAAKGIPSLVSTQQTADEVQDRSEDVIVVLCEQIVRTTVAQCLTEFQTRLSRDDLQAVNALENQRSDVAPMDADERAASWTAFEAKVGDGSQRVSPDYTL